VPEEEWGWAECVVDEGSGSVSYESRWVVAGVGAGGGGCCFFLGFVAFRKEKTLCPFGILSS
jgi:hypothetical protein